MRAARVTRLDGPDAIEVTEVDEPSGDGVVVEVHAAGAAFPDALLTRGLYQYRPEPPFVLGAEIAGVVRSAPDNAHVRPGDRVVGLTMLSGGMAEVAILQPDRVFKLPDNVSFEAGAGLLFNDLTVYFALTVRGRLQQGETVLVHGAAGGIGTSTLRLASLLGASRTIAVVSTEDKADVATAAGATDVVLAEGFKDAVKELTSGRGVDVVVDPVGGDRFTDSLRSLAPGGRLLVIGFTGGEIPTVKVNRLLLNNIDVVGVGWGAWAATHPDALGRAVGRTRGAAQLGPTASPAAGGLPAGAGRRGGRVARESHRQRESRGARPRVTASGRTCHTGLSDEGVARLPASERQRPRRVRSKELVAVRRAPNVSTLDETPVAYVTNPAERTHPSEAAGACAAEKEKVISLLVL